MNAIIRTLFPSGTILPIVWKPAQAQPRFEGCSVPVDVWKRPTPEPFPSPSAAPGTVVQVRR